MEVKKALIMALLILSLVSLYVGAVLFVMGFFMPEWFVIEDNSTMTKFGLFQDCTGPLGPHQYRPCAKYEGTEEGWMIGVQALEILELVVMLLTAFAQPIVMALKYRGGWVRCEVLGMVLTRFLLTMAGTLGIMGAVMFAGAELAVYPAGQFDSAWKLNLAGGILVFTAGKVLVQIQDKLPLRKDEEQTRLMQEFEDNKSRRGGP